MNTAYKKLNSFGFTIVELLVVISLLGVLAGILITVLNPQSQRNKAQDGVRLSNIAKASNAIEAFYAAEGKFPAAGSGGNPLNGVDGALLAAYVSVWPTDATYTYAIAGDSKSFAVYAPTATNSTGIIKYYSGSKKTQECFGSGDAGANANCQTTPTSYGTPTPTGGGTPTPTPTPSGGGTPTPTPTPSGGGTPSPTATPTPTATPIPTFTPTPTPTPTVSIGFCTCKTGVVATNKCNMPYTPSCTSQTTCSCQAVIPTVPF